MGSSCNLRSVFLDKRSGICVPSVPVTRVSFSREIIECKESWIGKQPVQVPSNVTITLEGQNLKVKGLLGELSRNYPQEVKIERDENGILQVKKALYTRIANQMHGLFRMTTPGDLQVKVEENTRIVVSGNDRCSIGEFAASIRRWRPPEPYKGKGVRYANEVIRLKEGKAGKKK
ncbi:hypothetical protein Peur_048795 [Populus x canadensis]